MKPAALLRLAVLSSVATLAATPPAHAASDTAESSRLVQSEMEFARRLASRFAYVELAEEVIASLESRDLNDSQLEGLGLLKCDVYASAAKAEGNKDKRLELYGSAIDSYRKFLEDHSRSDYIPAAQKSYVDLVNQYGRILEMQLEEVIGADADAARATIKEVVDGGLELITDLIDDTAGATSQADKNERWRLMLYQGQMLLTLANVADDGTYFFSRAESTLESLALEAGDTSVYTFNAYLLLARVKMAQSLYEEASDFSEYVVSIVLPDNDEARQLQGWDDLTFEEKVIRWSLAEQAMSLVIEAYQLQDDLPTACHYALHFYNMWKTEGFDIQPQGHLSLLAAARALVDSDGYVGGTLTGGNLAWFATPDEMASEGFSGNRNARSALDLALSIAQTVNDANKGNTLQTRAQKVISEIIERPGVVVSPDILFEAAQGDYFAKDYSRAIRGLKTILAQLDARDEATQRIYAPKVLFHIGDSLRKLERPLEAAMAFRDGATKWQGDPDYDEKIANGYYRAIGTARTESANDPLLENLYLEAENILRNVGSQTGTITFRQADRAYASKDYNEARKRYLEVEEGSNDYEKAVVKAALCLYKLEDTVNAKAEFTRYLDVYVQDPRTKPVDATKRSVREESMAIARFYLGRIAYSAGDWAEVIKQFETYAKDFSEQTDYAPTAMYMLTKAHLSSGDLGAAKRVVAAMREQFGTHERTGLTSLQIFDALKAEQEEAEASGDTEKARALKEQMADYLRLANALASEPSFNNMRKESTLWIELGQWTEAETVLNKIVSQFGTSQADDVDRFVRPDLGLVLLELKRVPEAYAVLDPLIPKEESDTRKASSITVGSWCRAVTGWLEGDGTTIVEVPGTGGLEDLEIATGFLRKLTDSEGASEKYTADWYQLKFETAYAYWQWGKDDSEQTSNAKVLIENLQSLTADTRLGDVADKCGNDTLQRRFLWLLDKVR